MSKKQNQNDYVFSIYKPFRNQIRKYNLIDSLFVIWGYSRNLTFDLPFPENIEILFGFDPSGKREIRRSKGVPEFELEFLFKEFIINCNDTATNDSLKSKKNLSRLVNYMRNNFRDEFDRRFSTGDRVLISFNRMAHNQFKWQAGHNPNIILRYYKLYSEPTLSALIEKQFDLTPYELFILGFMFYVHTGRNFIINPVKLEVNRLTTEMANKFLDNFSISIEEIKHQLIDCQQMNENLMFSFNPLIAKPILRLNDKFICPLQMLLFWQVTDGLYYRIVGEKGFENAYGRSFEKYIGEVIHKVIVDSSIKIYEEHVYGREEKRTCDWLLHDSNTILFIECKTKRITLSSKTELDISKGLREDLKKMASFICQLYKTYLDYSNNLYPDLTYDDSKKFVPLVLTLEDWFININPEIQELLYEMVISEFDSLELDHKLLDKYPYHIRSCDDFEKDIQIMKSIGLTTYFDKITKNELYEIVDKFEYDSMFEDEFIKTFLNPLNDQKTAVYTPQ